MRPELPLCEDGVRGGMVRDSAWDSKGFCGVDIDVDIVVGIDVGEGDRSS